MRLYEAGWNNDASAPFITLRTLRCQSSVAKPLRQLKMLAIRHENNTKFFLLTLSVNPPTISVMGAYRIEL